MVVVGGHCARDSGLLAQGVVAIDQVDCGAVRALVVWKRPFLGIVSLTVLLDKVGSILANIVL